MSLLIKLSILYLFSLKVDRYICWNAKNNGLLQSAELLHHVVAEFSLHQWQLWVTKSLPIESDSSNLVYQ